MSLKKSFLSFLSPHQWAKEKFDLMWPSEIFATVTISPLGQPILVSTGGEIWRLCRLTNCGRTGANAAGSPRASRNRC